MTTYVNLQQAQQGHHRGEKSHPKPDIKGWNGEIYGKEVLGSGLSGTVYAITATRVYKVATGLKFHRNDVKIEKEAYRRFEKKRKRDTSGFARCVLHSFVLDNPGLSGIVLERRNGTVRRRLATNLSSPASNAQVREWAVQAAKGLAFAHSCGIVHGDVGCHNMLLDSSDQLGISDFAGSSIDGRKATVSYEDWSCRSVQEVPTVMTDLFALGSAIYEMSTGHPPWHDDDPVVVRSKFENGEYPSLSGLSLAPVIEKLWGQYYFSAAEVVTAIDPDSYARKPPPKARRDRQHAKKPKVVAPSIFSPFSASSSWSSKVSLSSRVSSSLRSSNSFSSSLSLSRPSSSKHPQSHTKNAPPSPTSHRQHKNIYEPGEDAHTKPGREPRKASRKRTGTNAMSLLSRIVHPNMLHLQS
jgi:serine/threonine protein kinase